MPREVKPSTSPVQDRYVVQAADAALALLTLVGEHRRSSLTHLSGAAGLTTSQTFRLLVTLEQRGFVLRHEDKTYSLGYAAHALGRRASLQLPLLNAAGDVLDHLRDDTNETALLAVRNGLQAAVLDVRESRQTVRVVATLDERGDLHIGGTGKVLLAYSDPTVLEHVLSRPLRRYTDQTITSADELRTVLEQVRHDGLCVARADFEADSYSVAAPVLDRHGQLIAALAVAGPLARFDPQQQERVRTLVRTAARTLASRLEQPPVRPRS
ncbi:IclR family transcriptional regulator [Deinococcus pimensis]|uniref:IclR family transcriptional regulator n=1 Tax=Deinococcus pimensis TaxID=309888 RepID=UPI0004BB0A4B|nr:IclR family transcriptional regulator [Deinococcus pimensis]